LLEGLRGPIPPQLLLLIHQVFDKLDSQSKNSIRPDVLLENFNSNRHPEVSTGDKSADEVLQEFLDTFDVGTVKSGVITRDEFVKYYHNMYMVINDDSYMELILRRVWNLNEDDDAMEQANLLSGRMNSNTMKGRIQNAQTFGSQNYNNNTRDSRPSTSGGMRTTASNPNTPRGMAMNSPLSIQGNQFMGDQSLPPPLSSARPKSASHLKGGRSYQLMSNSTNKNSMNNNNDRTQSIQSKSIFRINYFFNIHIFIYSYSSNGRRES
jgi:hypothetical protein